MTKKLPMYMLEHLPPDMTKEELIHNVKTSLLRQAIGYKVKEVFRERKKDQDGTWRMFTTKTKTSIVKPDLRACLELMKLYGEDKEAKDMTVDSKDEIMERFRASREAIDDSG